MNDISDYYYSRRFFAMLFFIAGFACGIGFFVSGMGNYILLILMVIFFILTYFIAPYPQGRGSSRNWTDYFLDEWLISGFFYLISLPFRMIGLIIRMLID